MPLINRCCCCSLETGTKIIGYIQTIVGFILTAAVLFYLIMVIYLRDEVLNLARADAKALNSTGGVELDDDVASQKIAFGYIVLATVMILAYVLCTALMGAMLLTGVYKRKLPYIKWWVRIKTVLVMMATGWLLLQLLLLLYGMDADLTKSIISLVYDGCLIAVVNSYYDQENEKTDFAFENQFSDVPLPAYC